MLIAESVQAMQKERRKMTNPEANLQGPTETMPTTNARSIVYCCHNIDIINDPNAATNASSRQALERLQTKRRRFQFFQAMTYFFMNRIVLDAQVCHPILKLRTRHDKTQTSRTLKHLNLKTNQESMSKSMSISA